MVTALVLAAAVVYAVVPAASGSSSDEQATHAYLLAQYQLTTALLRDLTAASGPQTTAGAVIARECPGVVTGIPKEAGTPLLTLTPRAKGENARLAHQKKTINEELGAAVEGSDESLYRPALEAFAREVRALSWSNAAIAPAVQAGVAARLESETRQAPPVCADARAWAASGFRALSAASREFDATRTARENANEGLEGTVTTLLKPFENASDRALVERTNAEDFGLGALSTFETLLRVERTLGFPQSELPKPRKSAKLGEGHTVAGTRFEVSSGGGVIEGPGCRHSVTVAYTRPGAPDELIVGGPNNPICLSSPQYRHPAVFCEVGIETVQAAVPAAVRSVRLVRANARTIESRVIRVPRRDGGPAGVYAQQLRGSTSHAVSLVELDAGGTVVLTVRLPGRRCVKHAGELEDFPTVTRVAVGHTPEGEPFAITAFGTINGEPFLNVNNGVDPEINSPALGIEPRSAFGWSLRVGCAPHPYAIIYGVLLPPGASVTAQTPGGTVALSEVALQPPLPTKGPLVYGVFSAVPSELTVLGSGGSTVHSESLHSQATEAAQFCEGYAES